MLVNMSEFVFGFSEDNFIAKEQLIQNIEMLLVILAYIPIIRLSKCNIGLLKTIGISDFQRVK